MFGGLRVFPVEMKTSATTGRSLFASRDVGAGELLMTVAPFGIAVFHNHVNRFCAGCLRFVTVEEEPLELHCTCGQLFFCSTL